MSIFNSGIHFQQQITSLLIEGRLSSGARGFLISLTFKNMDLRNNVEIWFPIDGYIDLIKNIEREYICRLLEITEKWIDNNRILVSDDYLLEPAKTNFANFVCIVEPHIASRLYNYINSVNIDNITFSLRLVFSVLFNAGSVSQKTMKVTPLFHLNINKYLLRAWINNWYAFYLEAEEALPATIPPDVADNYFEAVKSFNAGAYRASAVMARRTLELALLKKGLITTKDTIGRFVQSEKSKPTNQRKLSSKLLALLDAVRVFGDYGAHAWDDALNDITETEARLTLDALKNALIELFGNS